MDYLYGHDLAKELDDLNDEFDENGGHLDDQEDSARRDELINLADEFGGVISNHCTLIPDIEFEEYARQLAYDVGMLEEDSTISMYIDWSKWADDLRVEYIEVDLGGYSYQVQSE